VAFEWLKQQIKEQIAEIRTAVFGNETPKQPQQGSGHAFGRVEAVVNQGELTEARRPKWGAEIGHTQPQQPSVPSQSGGMNGGGFLYSEPPQVAAQSKYMQTPQQPVTAKGTVIMQAIDSVAPTVRSPSGPGQK
jgi:hypothetical protein